MSQFRGFPIAVVLWTLYLLIGASASGAEWTYDVGSPPRGLGADQDLLFVGTIPGRLVALRETPASPPPPKRLGSCHLALAID